MKLIRFEKIVITLILLSATGCASLNSRQDRELHQWEREGVAVEDKNTTAATLLGLLPGVGSFYTGQIGLGVVDLLLWPLSIFWDTVSGYQGAQVKNWEASSFNVESLEKNRKNALNQLEDMHDRSQISDVDYKKLKREVNATPLKELEKPYDLDSAVNHRVNPAPKP
jgi:hypothetical protein